MLTADIEESRNETKMKYAHFYYYERRSRQANVAIY